MLPSKRSDQGVRISHFDYLFIHFLYFASFFSSFFFFFFFFP